MPHTLPTTRLAASRRPVDRPPDRPPELGSELAPVPAPIPGPLPAPTVDKPGPAPTAIRWLDGSTAASPFSIASSNHVVVGNTAQLPRSSLLLGLSAALDLTEGQLPGHALRTTYLAVRVASRLGLGEIERADLFHASVLKDAGCSSNSAAISEIFGGDDIELKRRQATVDRSILAYAAFAISSLPPAEPLPARLRRLISIGLRGRGARRAVEQLRCERGASIARKAGFPDSVATAIHDVHEHWDGHGEPRGLRGDLINHLARIIAACAAFDVFLSIRGRDEARRMVTDRRGTWYDPDVVDGLLSAVDSGLIDDLEAPDLMARTVALEPSVEAVIAGDDQVDEIASAFADIIDAKSPYTGSHSQGVARLANAMAVRIGLPDRDVIDIRRAALLHDLGKLGVPNTVLDKPGALDTTELDLVRRHPELSLRILSPIPKLSRVAELAACHHERLDGRGYFRGLAAEELAIGARIVAVADVFEALTANRPYRAAMTVERAFEILRLESGGHLAADVVEVLRDVID